MPLGLGLDFLRECMKKLFCEFLEHLWCFLDAFWRFLVGPGRLLLVFDGFGASLVLLFTGANGSRQALFTGANGSRLGVMSLPPPPPNPSYQPFGWSYRY